MNINNENLVKGFIDGMKHNTDYAAYGLVIKQGYIYVADGTLYKNYNKANEFLFSFKHGKPFIYKWLLDIIYQEIDAKIIRDIRKEEDVLDLILMKKLLKAIEKEL